MKRDMKKLLRVANVVFVAVTVVAALYGIYAFFDWLFGWVVAFYVMVFYVYEGGYFALEVYCAPEGGRGSH